MAVALLFVGCARPNDPEATITLATTTSTRDSGLLDGLLPRFEEETGIEVKVVAVGSGQALELGRRGDADVLLTHAPDAEAEFVAEGHGVSRRPMMHNDFVLVGPMDDPANVADATSAVGALRRIADAQAQFVSRGDDSGTHRKEESLWRQAKFEPQGAWYLRAGAGMAAALRMAGEKSAYALCDRGTFLARGRGLGLAVVSQEDPVLRNQYAVIVVNSASGSQASREAARRFADFLLSEPARKVIAEFGEDVFGEPLFFPNPSSAVGAR